MSDLRDIIRIGFDKNGEADFRITMAIQNLSLEQMQALRAMIPVAIGVGEDLFRQRIEANAQAGTATPPCNGGES